MKKPLINILIIDDCRDDHELYREYLSNDMSVDYRFFDAYDGAQGERMYLENAIDCVIIDYRMPDTDGLELLKKLTQRQDVVPAVMLTGDGNETIAVIAMQIGSQDYIPKRVVTPDALKRSINRTVERSRLMQEMEHYRQQLERSNQDLERFVSVVAHDLKSPLRAISQHLQLVHDQTQEALGDKTKKSMYFAIDGAERMRCLIDSMFELSRIGFEKRSFEQIDCNQLLENVKSNLQANIEERDAIITACALPHIVADRVQIIQLLQNLIGNAIKYCKERPSIRINARQEGAMWVFSVNDNGIGIPAESQDKIFTIFKRLHNGEREYAGCGVGLAICERVVKNHGGAIRVESESGKGSTFFFSLPVRSAAKREKAA